MSFWENVEYVREFRNLTRKELAYKADFSINSISTGISRGSFPSVDVAYRIAKVLNVSVEFLVSVDVQKVNNFDAKPPHAVIENENIIAEELFQRNQCFLKYKNILKDFTAIAPEIQKPIEDLIHRLAAAPNTVNQTIKN